MNKKFNPFQLDHTYNETVFKHDLIAGLTLFVMLIPQSMAYAMLAGLPPVMGLYASTIPLIIYAFFASSKHLSVGPVAITSLLVFSGVSIYAEPGSGEYITIALTLAMMVGVIQLLLGVLNGGFVVKFIPQSVMSGYTTAAAIIIGLSQLKHLLGIDVGNYLQIHLLFLDIVDNMNGIHLTTLAVGLVSVIGLLVLGKLYPRLPSALIIVVGAIGAVMLFRLDELGLQTIGHIPQGFPGLTIPNFSIQTIQMLFPMALTIALLGFMESLAISQTIAQKENYKIYPNKELRALGLANIIGSFFHSFPVNGSYSRTAVNHEAGGRTQVTSIITAASVIITVLFFTSLFYYLPNAVLASIIIVAIYKLIDFKTMVYLFNIKPLEGWIWLITLLVTLFVGIQWGIIIGAIFTLVLIIIKSAKPNIVQLGYVKDEKTFRDIKWYPNAVTSQEVLIVRIDSSLHFANIAFFEEKIKINTQKNKNIQWIIADMSGVNDIDTVSIKKLEEMIISYQKKRDITVIFANMKGDIRDLVNTAGWDVKFKEQENHLTLEQLIKAKGLVSYFYQPEQKSAEDYSI
ncbi:SulP family inorganic anion transporter [Salipaludibacillus sp. HK11]|uniref:SulP family inorganic anion transporter n=1 Tax=Salipaludibacillus sp. HK11 TaxID=3394320 RepID=UPI0039FBEC88